MMISELACQLHTAAIHTALRSFGQPRLDIRARIPADSPRSPAGGSKSCRRDDLRACRRSAAEEARLAPGDQVEQASENDGVIFTIDLAPTDAEAGWLPFSCQGTCEPKPNVLGGICVGQGGSHRRRQLRSRYSRTPLVARTSCKSMEPVTRTCFGPAIKPYDRLLWSDHRGCPTAPRNV